MQELTMTCILQCADSNRACNRIAFGLQAFPFTKDFFNNAQLAQKIKFMLLSGEYTQPCDQENVLMLSPGTKKPFYYTLDKY